MRRDPRPAPAAATTASDIELALDRLAQIMVADGEDGALYLPIYQRLERELVAAQKQEDAMERARARANSRKI